MAEPGRKILLLTDDMTPRGAGMDVRLLIGEMARQGASIRVICEEAEVGLPGASVQESPGLAVAWRQPWVLRNLGLDKDAAAPKVLHVLKTSMSDAGLWLAERWEIPYYLTVDEFLAVGDRLRLSKKWCRGLFAPNEELARDLIQGVGIPESLVHVIRPGIVPVDRPGRSPSRGSAAGGPIAVVGTAAPLTAGSGIATFLNAARRVLDTGLDAEFVIAGSGEEEIELRRRADRLAISDRVTFAADASPGDAFWRVLDVYCQPSILPTVGRGLRIALAHGVASVASEIEGLESLIVPDATGLRVPPNDTNSLARAIVELLQAPDRAEALGHAAREQIRRDYDPEAEARAILGHYASAMRPAPRE